MNVDLHPETAPAPILGGPDLNEANPDSAAGAATRILQGTSTLGCRPDPGCLQPGRDRDDAGGGRVEIFVQA